MSKPPHQSGGLKDPSGLKGLTEYSSILALIEVHFSHDWREWITAGRYDAETQVRVVKVSRKRSNEAPKESATDSVRRIHEPVGIPTGTMRGWVKRAEVGAGNGPGVTSSEQEELKRLRHPSCRRPGGRLKHGKRRTDFSGGRSSKSWSG